MSQSPSVAIVDDDPDVRESLDSLMRSAGLSARGYGGAIEFLDDSASGDFACVVTDLHMPGMSGIELQAAIAHRGWLVPLIVMTGFATDGVRDQVLAAGAYAFLIKPVDPDALLEAIAAAIG